MSVMTKVNGNKTYIAGGLAVITGLYGFLSGEMNMMTAWKIILAGFGVLGFRSAIKKME